MKPTWLKDAFLTIKSRFISWLSVVTIVLIGASVIMGLIFTRNSIDTFYNGYLTDQNFEDLKMTCSIGVKENELDEILKWEGVRDAEGIISLKGTAGGDGKNAGVDVLSMTERINIPSVTEGRLPENEDECVLCAELCELLDVKPGDEIDLVITTTGFANILKHSRYRITGIALHPEYMEQKADDYVILPLSGFNTERSLIDYTAVLIDTGMTDQLGVFDSESMEILASAKLSLDKKTEALAKNREAGLEEELNELYKEAEEEIQGKLEEAQSKIYDAEKKYKEKIEEGRKQLEVAEKQLEEGKAAALKAISETGYGDGEGSFEFGTGEISEEYQEKLAELIAAEKEIDEKRAELDDASAKAEEELGRARADLEEAELKAEAELNDLRKQLDETVETGCNWLIQTRNTNPYFFEFGTFIEAIKNLFLLFTPLFGAIVVLVCFFTVVVIVGEQSKEIGTCKAFGAFNSEIRRKYVIFGTSAAIIGAGLGIIGGFIFEAMIFNALKTTTAFGVIPHMSALITIFITPLGAALLTGLAAAGACRRYNSCSAVGLIRGNEPEKRTRRKAAAKESDRVYMELIKNNFLMDLGRESVSAVIIILCTLLIGTAMTIRLSFGAAIEEQQNDIWHYDIKLTESENITQDEKTRLLKAIEDYECMYTTSFGAIIQNGGEQILTEVICVNDEDTFNSYFSFKDENDNPVKIPEKGVLVTQEMSERNGLTDGQSSTLITTGVKKTDVEIGENFVYHFGKLMIMSSDYYKESFGETAEPNTWFIRTGGANKQKVAEWLMEFKGVSGAETSESLEEIYGDTLALYEVVVIVAIVFSLMLSFMILLNLSNILVAHRMKELLTMKVNGFSDGQVIGYLAREIIVTLALGVIIGLAIGILFITKALEGIETDSFMYVRKPFVLAWIVAASSNVVFSICINTIAFRKINKVPLIDIRKY